jgi:hypothetical protein
MLAVLQLFLHEADIHLQLDQRVLDDTLKRLRLFILRSRVTLELAPLAELLRAQNDPPAPAPAAAETGPGRVPEIGGRQNGLDPTRYGDWEKNGRCIDF